MKDLNIKKEGKRISNDDDNSLNIMHTCSISFDEHDVDGHSYASARYQPM